MSTSRADLWSAMERRIIANGIVAAHRAAGASSDPAWARQLLEDAYVRAGLEVDAAHEQQWNSVL